MKKFKAKFLKYLFYKIHQYRVLTYSSRNVVQIEGNPIINQPTIMEGKGKILFEKNVILGIYPSPYFFSGSIYLEARHYDARIFIDENTFINNNVCIIADKTLITIGKNVLIGTNVEIFDSDFHSLDPNERLGLDYDCFPVFIKDNVFIGSNVRILKGVTIGENSVIGNSSVVVKNISANVLAVGNPAKVIRSII